VCMNIECSEKVRAELKDAFRYNDAVLRHLILSKDAPETEISYIMKTKDEKPGRRRDDEFNAEEGIGTGDSDQM
jgi:small subunit ribosomal protein S6